MQYDALGRVTQSFAPNREQTVYSYVGRQTKVTGIGRDGYPDKVLRWTETDGLGNLAVVRSGSSSGAEVSSVALAYDALGNLKTVDMPSVGVTTMTYDLGGRKVQMEDPDLGTWSYGYNRQGQLVRQTDANGWTACLYYDSLGRLASQYFQPHTACPAAGDTLQRTVYGYDGGHSATNRSRGQLTSVTKYDSNGTLTYTRSERFDGAGRLASQAVRVWSSGPYTTSYSYDAWSRPQTTVYPDGEQVTVGYGAQGLPVRLVSSQWGVLVNGAVKDGPYSDAAAYDLTGQLVQARYPAGGNLWRTAASFPWLGSDGNSNRRLQYLLVGSGPGSGDRYQTYLSYDTYANVKARSEFVGPDRQENYGYLYDVQNRVSRGTYRQYAPGDVLLETLVEGHTYAAAGWPQTFGAGSFSQLRGHFSAPANGGYQFDANGNVRNRTGQEFIWDAENHLAQVNWGSPLRSEYYSYDEAGVRVRKAEGMTGGPVTANTYYLFSHYERRTSGGVTTPTKRYFFGNMLVAQDVGGQLTYLHTDHLGSVVLQTDTNGAVVNDQRYFAFGRRLDKSGDISGEIDFTGQKRDATGLLYFNARYYDPQIGQFISPDTIVPDPTLLIDYNRYLYSRGNPLKYNDPTGHIPEREACSYLRACSEDEFVNKYGQELANLLWGTDVTWGDKVSWDNDNTGMLVLLEAGDGRHTGVLWGIAGRGAGEPIYLDMLHKEGITSFDTTEATDVDTV